MKFAIIVLLTLLTPAQRKNDPNGIWEGDGTQFELRMVGTELHVRLIPESNPLLVSYQLVLTNQGEVNTYAGKGFFVARVKEDKECRFDVEWELIVANETHIVATIPAIVPDPDTCAVRQRQPVPVELVRK